MGKLHILLGFSLTVIFIAYVLDEPLDDGITQQWKIKLILGVNKIVTFIANCIGFFGCDNHAIVRCIWHSLSDIAPLPIEPDVVVKDMEFNGITVRLYTPTTHSNDKKRGMIYYHGGGWTLGTLNMFESQMLQYSKHLDAVVVSVDYRLAPEHVFPAAVDDCEKATRHFINNAEVFGVDSARIAIAGDSAGGNLAAAIALKLRDSGFKLMPKLQILIYPVLQAMSLDTPSYRANYKRHLATKDSVAIATSSYLTGKDFRQYRNEFYMDNHTTPIIKRSNAKTFLNINILPDDELKNNYEAQLDFGNTELWNRMQKKLMNPYFSPLFARDHLRLPKTYITTCQYDVLRDDGFFYAKRLRDVKVDVTHVNLRNCIHGWTLLYKASDTFQNHFDEMLNFINQNL